MRCIMVTGNIVMYTTFMASINIWLQIRDRLTARGVGRGRLCCQGHFSPALKDTVSLSLQPILICIRGGGGGVRSAGRYAAYANKRLSSSVFERCTSSGIRIFAPLSRDFEQLFVQISSKTVKTLSNTNLVASRNIKREKASLPVNVHRSKTSLLKLQAHFVLILISFE